MKILNHRIGFILFTILLASWLILVVFFTVGERSVSFASGVTQSTYRVLPGSE